MLLNIYFGPTVNAARGVAVQASGSLSGLFRNVQVASAPQIVKTYSAGQIGETNKLITFTCKISIFLIFILALPIFLEVDQVLNLWLVNPPTHTAIFIKLILIDSLINTSSYPMFQAIMATGHIKKYQLISSIAVIMGVLLTWFLLSNGAPPHSAFTTTIGISTFLLWRRLSFLNDKLHFSLRRYFQHVILPATKVMLAGGLIPMLVHINLPESTLRLGIVTLATFILTPVAVILFGLQKNESDLLRRKFTDKFRSFLSNIR
jgi:O-antigen/teichoic acid export membrane protein